jgi:hypothetical protein
MIATTSSTLSESFSSVFSIDSANYLFPSLRVFLSRTRTTTLFTGSTSQGTYRGNHKD